MPEKDALRINDIIRTTLDTIEKSRGAIFDIAEGARREVNTLRNDMEKLKLEVQHIIEENDRLEGDMKRHMQRMAVINRDFAKFSQDEMRNAYEAADKVRVALAVSREREQQSILRRNDLERRFRDAVNMVNKADQLVVQVGTVLQYLSGDLEKVSNQLESADNKRSMALRVIKAHEEERNRVAREIHDGPAQAMSNIVLKAEICEKLSHVDIDRTRKELENLKELVRGSLKEVRRIIYDLRPMSLDDLGLKPTLQKYTESFSVDTGVRVETSFRGNEALLTDRNMILSLFRIVQECLNNVKKYAKAGEVTVQLEYAQQGVTVRVRDNGVGFDMGEAHERKRDDGGGFGLFGMKERVELLAGTMDIDSAPGMGTTIRVHLPYNGEEV